LRNCLTVGPYRTRTSSSLSGPSPASGPEHILTHRLAHSRSVAAVDGARIPAARRSSTACLRLLADSSQVKTWTHLVAIVDPVNHYVELEADGGNSGDSAYQENDSLAPPVSGGPLDMGFAPDGDHFTGQLSDVRTYDYPLAYTQSWDISAERD
jgi:hypothetical protein